MGAADAVPGISGGTVALILGIYQRLINAISRVGKEAVVLLKTRRWKSLAEFLDLKFLVCLAPGILSGLLVFVVLLHELIGEPDHPAWTRPFIYAIFFGAIAGSTYLVGKMVQFRNQGHAFACVALAVAGAIFAWWLTGLPALEGFTSAPNLMICFLLGSIAISAMILPGISGSYLLLVFGAYHYFSGIPKAILKGKLVFADLIAFAAFALGCLIGLLGFSRVLKWLLRKYHSATLAVMGGFMVGALRKLWPWQGDEVEPAQAMEFPICIVLIVASAVAILAIDHFARPVTTDGIKD